MRRDIEVVTNNLQSVDLTSIKLSAVDIKRMRHAIEEIQAFNQLSLEKEGEFSKNIPEAFLKLRNPSIKKQRFKGSFSIADWGIIMCKYLFSGMIVLLLASMSSFTYSKISNLKYRKMLHSTFATILKIFFLASFGKEIINTEVFEYSEIKRRIERCDPTQQYYIPWYVYVTGVIVKVSLRLSLIYYEFDPLNAKFTLGVEDIFIWVLLQLLINICAYHPEEIKQAKPEHKHNLKIKERCKQYKKYLEENTERLAAVEKLVNELTNRSMNRNQIKEEFYISNNNSQLRIESEQQNEQ